MLGYVRLNKGSQNFKGAWLNKNQTQISLKNAIYFILFNKSELRILM